MIVAARKLLTDIVLVIGWLLHKRAAGKEPPLFLPAGLEGSKLNSVQQMLSRALLMSCLTQRY